LFRLIYFVRWYVITRYVRRGNKFDLVPLHTVMIAELFNKSTKPMTLVKFRTLILWFGPVSQRDHHILNEIERVMRQPWFFGTLDSTGAETLLKNSSAKKEGLFLVRLNTGGRTPIEESPFTISRVGEDCIVNHIRIYPIPHGYYIKLEQEIIKVEGSVVDLIAAIQLHKPKICGEVCFGHPFSQTFEESTITHNYIVYLTDDDNNKSKDEISEAVVINDS